MDGERAFPCKGQAWAGSPRVDASATPVPIQPFYHSPLLEFQGQAEPQETKEEAMASAARTGETPETQEYGKAGTSEVESMLDEEKGESEALTSYLRGLLQDEPEMSPRQTNSPLSPSTERASSFAFLRRLADLKNGF